MADPLPRCVSPELGQARRIRYISCHHGVVVGRTEGLPEERHGHVTCLVVHPAFRRRGIATDLMRRFAEECELLSIDRRLYFVDLFVRPSNERAVAMYRSLGYAFYAGVERYYSSGPSPEDAHSKYELMPCHLVMRLALKADPEKTTMQPILDRSLTDRDLERMQQQ